MTNCPYQYRCKSYPLKCSICKENEKEDHFKPKDIYPWRHIPREPYYTPTPSPTTPRYEPNRFWCRVTLK